MDTGKTYDEIMRDITSGLTGDAGQDVSYLTLQMEKYKDHPMRKEIARACGRLLNKYIPEDAKEAIARKLSNDLEAIYLIDSDMTMLPCSFDQKRQYAFKLRPKTIEDGWNSLTFDSFRDRLKSACPDCQNHDLCKGGCPLLPEIVFCNNKERTT